MTLERAAREPVAAPSAARGRDGEGDARRPRHGERARDGGGTSVWHGGLSAAIALAAIAVLVATWRRTQVRPLLVPACRWCRHRVTAASTSCPECGRRLEGQAIADVTWPRPVVWAVRTVAIVGLSQALLVLMQTHGPRGPAAELERRRWATVGVRTADGAYVETLRVSYRRIERDVAGASIGSPGAMSMRPGMPVLTGPPPPAIDVRLERATGPSRRRPAVPDATLPAAAMLRGGSASAGWEPVDEAEARRLAPEATEAALALVRGDWPAVQRLSGGVPLDGLDDVAAGDVRFWRERWAVTWRGRYPAAAPGTVAILDSAMLDELVDPSILLPLVLPAAASLLVRSMLVGRDLRQHGRMRHLSRAGTWPEVADAEVAETHRAAAAAADDRPRGS